MSTISSASASSGSIYGYTTTASGLDIDALIEEAVAAKLEPVDTLETKIEDNDTKIASYEELQSALSSLSDAANALRKPSGTTASSDDVFLSRTAYLSASGESDADDLMDVTVEDGTDVGTYDITIEQIAKVQKVMSGSVSNSSDPLGYSGTFSLGLEDGDTADIEVDNGMSLEDLKDAINDQSDGTGVSASIIAVSDTEYVLVLTATETGKDITTSAADGDDTLTSLGVTDDSGDFANVLQKSQDAIIKVDGLTITRDGNDISDVIEGVSLHLYGADPDTTVSLEVDEDLTGIKEAIEAFVEAYNVYREIVSTNQQVDASGVAADGAVLFGDTLLRSSSLDISNLLTSSHNDISLADLGITMNESNELELDEDELNEALLGNLDDIESLFAFTMDSSSPDLKLLNRGDDLGDTSFTLDVTLDGDGNIVSAGIDGDTSLFTISGSRIKGAEGTIYEGLTLVWTGTGSESVDLSFSSGIAEGLYNTGEIYSDPDGGLIQDVIDSLTDANEDMESEISDLAERAENYQSMLETKYAAMEAAVAKAQTMLDTINAILNASDD